MTIDHGLQEKQLELIKDICGKFANCIDKVSLFGSRATGSYKSYSDIDLVVYGNINDKSINNLWTRFHESSLPYKVDINAYHLITHQPLKDNIDRHSKTLFSKNQLLKS